MIERTARTLLLAWLATATAGYVSSQEGPATPRADAQYRLDPIPAPLRRVENVHPRMFVPARRLKELRSQITTTHAAIWRHQLKIAEAGCGMAIPVYKKRDRWSGDLQAYQRSVGRMLPEFALAYLLSGEKRYLDAARSWALASCRFPTWGLGKHDGVSLTASDQLLNLSLVYDWCHDELGEEASKIIRATLEKRGAQMFRGLASKSIHWHRSYLCNQYNRRVTAVGLAGFALYGETPAAPVWIGYALQGLKKTMESLGNDGVSSEGAGYWTGGVQDIMMLLACARELLGADLFDHPWLRNTSMYALYLTLPRGAWTRDNVVADFGDCRRKFHHGPDYILRGLAGEFRDGYAQWLGEELDNAHILARPPFWMNLVWYDPSVQPKPPTDLPTLRHFEDMGIVSARSDWTDSASLLLFKCGPFMGHKAIQGFDYNPAGGHQHPDANHFSLFGAGEWLIRDDGYTVKRTGNHNTLLVNGRGQLGEGGDWFDAKRALAARSRPRIVRSLSTPGLEHVAGDATDAYPKALGLKSYERHVLFLKPDVLIVLDDVRSEREADLELRFHPEHHEHERDGVALMFDGKSAKLRLELLTEEGTTMRAEDVRDDRRSKPFFAVRIKARRKDWRNAVALSWGKLDTSLPRITLTKKGDRWGFRTKGRTLVFDWAKGRATLRRD